MGWEFLNCFCNVLLMFVVCGGAIWKINWLGLTSTFYKKRMILKGCVVASNDDMLWIMVILDRCLCCVQSMLHAMLRAGKGSELI